MLISPDGRISADDDSGEDEDAKIQFSDHLGEEWIVIVTTLRSNVYGQYSLLTENVVHNSVPVSNIEMDLVERAFAERGILDADRVRAEQLANLTEQLSLSVNRDELLSRIESRKAIIDQEGSRVRLASLEEKVFDLNSAYEKLEDVPKIVNELIEKELSETKQRIDVLLDDIVSAELKVQAYDNAERLISDLDSEAKTIEAITSRIIKPSDSNDLSDLRRELSELERSYVENSSALAEMLIESKLVNEFFF